jgi:hypothetical protein
MPDKYDKMLEDYFTVTEKDFKVKLVKLNWDEECRRDFLFDKGFEIKEPGFKGKEEKSLYGIHSPLFATDYGDDDAFADRYSCKCRETIGRLYDGEICPICKTKVVFRDVDLKITGWIILKKYKVIQPIFYKMIRSIIGEKMFTEMIEFDKEITRDGILLDKKSKNPFKGIGMLEFQERFEEIMEYFKKKKKDKLELITDVLKEKEKVFTSCIPVYSSVLRPVAFKGESFSYTPIDKKYNVIFSLVRSINEGATSVVQSKRKRKKMDNPTKIYSLQKKIMDLWTLVFNEINQKDGHKKLDVTLHGNM